MSGFELIVYILIAFYTISSIGVVIVVCVQTIFASPSTVIKVILSSAVFAAIGYLRQGYVSVELVLFGLAGFLAYLSYLLAIKEYF